MRISHHYSQIKAAPKQILQASERILEEQRSKKKMRKIKRQIKKARGRGHWYEQHHILHLMRHLLPLWIIGALMSASNTYAQVLENIFQEDPYFDSIPIRSLRAEVDAIAFFHDNEYTSQVQKGYSLPGVRLTPHLAYNPLHRINIELGASMLIFNGANKYPCYAYHDIGTWKGDQYQSGAHVLPWARLQAHFDHLDIVIGNIYGGSNHRLSAPLYNAEQNLSADPEMGIQLLSRSKHFQTDTWLNWQSYIFKEASHQEAFTVGEHAQILWGDKNATWQWITPIQLTIQHRGGEQDTTSMGVQTLCNASLGIRVEGKNLSRKINHFAAQTNAIACYQQAGNLWAFDTGFAIHTGAEMTISRHINLAADYVHVPKQFVSLFGNPYFGTISLKKPGISYHGMNVIRLAAGYQYTFAKNYTLGTNLEVFSNHTKAKGNQPSLHETNFSFGLYFRVAPSFLIKKF